MTTRMWADCSNTQGHAADGAALREMGCTALAAKASQGADFTDQLLGENYSQAKAAGLDFIAYHFLDTSDGAAQAQHFVDAVQAACGTLEIGLMADWEKLNGAFPSPATVDAFLGRLAELAPQAAISVYTAAWVISGAGGQSSEATNYPLVWSNYVPPNPPAPAMDPRTILKDVTPGLFEAFGGWTAYVARQFTDNAVAGGFGVVDFNVCFDDEAYERLFGTSHGAPKPPPTPPPAKPASVTDALQAAVHQKVDGVWGSTTDAALELVRSAAFLDERPDVKALQQVLGTTADGDWGPNSQAALSATVKAIQKALGGGLAIDGSWGAATDARFTAERKQLLHA